ncbi:MAG TPA: Tm-1-like ATP-binding domain-containing protein [Ilumatobacteraceae bacterium]|nr:Tm-1-like ATP-binding domain-containing protein [Ilumatobacteraceae bacterium]
MTTVAILATMDTKAAEVRCLSDAVVTAGGTPYVIDIGVVGDADQDVDVTNETVAERGGTPLSELRIDPSREVASEVMVAGATAITTELVEAGTIDAIVGLGGTQGTNNGSQVMQSLPYGFPKIMVSTMASGDTSPYVGIKDITMMFSVSDILGVNPLLRQVLANAAAAAVGMGAVPRAGLTERDRPVVAITNLGVLTAGTMRAMERLDAAGYDSIVFHAVGSGGRAMEQLMREGVIDAVFDYALGDLSDAELDGLRAADEDRLTVAAELGLPQVVVPGGTDHIGIMLDAPNEVPDRFADRTYTFHNPVILVPRTSAEELQRVAAVIGQRLANASDNTVVMAPTAGLSSYSVPGGALVDPAADRALLDALRAALPETVDYVEVDAGAEEPAFVDAAVDRLVSLIEASAK